MSQPMRRRKKKGHENSERWLVSYADLVTLLFAFFVVLFASTQSDKSRVKQISQAVEEALQTSSISPQVAAMLGGAKAKEKSPQSPPSPLPEKPVDPNLLQLDLPNAIRTLETTLGPEMKQGQVSVHLERRGAVISLSSQSAFPSGGDTVSEGIYPLLAKVSKTLNQLPNPIRLEGNTDSLPINNERFHDNWALSAARSIAMLRILNERYGIGCERMAVVGYADTNALADNSTEEGRMKNRRVDLVILSDYGKTTEPGARTN
jgi:chemotaxis protein MotB